MASAELDGIKVIVAGSGAIGSVIAKTLAQSGADVGLTFARNSSAAEGLAKTIRAMGRRSYVAPCDVTNPEAPIKCLAELSERLNGCDALVSAIGHPGLWKHVAEITPAEWAEAINVEVNGSFNLIHAALPHLRAHGGAIVALSSIAASMFQSRNAQGAAAKAALEALIRVLAREEGRHQIRANAVAIGLTESPLTDDAFAKWGDATAARVVAGIALKRIARPEDVAAIVKFLIGREGCFVTGQVIGADGGQYIGH